MSNAVFKGHASGTGTVTLETPNTNSDRTISLPDSNGTVMVSGNMPAFSAYPSSGQVVTSGNNKILFGTEEFDTNNNFASSRFTPTVAGYYQLNAFVSGTWTNLEVAIYIYKNGANFKLGTDIKVPTGGLNYGVGVNSLVYANGTTDYFEIYLYSDNSQTLGSSATGTWFNGSMVRGA